MHLYQIAARKAIGGGRGGFQTVMLSLNDMIAHRTVTTEAVLTPREVETLKLVAIGLPNKAIASQMGISHKTVEHHRDNMMRKTGCNSGILLTHFALRHGIVNNLCP